LLARGLGVGAHRVGPPAGSLRLARRASRGSAARCTGTLASAELQHAVVELRPVPRLEGEAERVVPAVRHTEPEPGGIVLEPEERFGVLELLRQRPAAGRRDVDRLAGMVLAVARRRVDAEDLADVVAARELRTDQR